MTDYEQAQMKYAKETVYAFFNVHEDTSVLETFKVSLHELITLYKQGVRHGINVTSSSKHQWSGLTDQDLAACKSDEFVVFARGIEAMLKERNSQPEHTPEVLEAMKKVRDQHEEIKKQVMEEWISGRHS